MKKNVGDDQGVSCRHLVNTGRCTLLVVVLTDKPSSSDVSVTFLATFPDTYGEKLMTS